MMTLLGNAHMERLFTMTYKTEPTEPLLDRAVCPKCNWKGRVDLCETEEESEGWEYPSYTVHLCPVCGEYLDDYHYSRDGIKHLISYY